MISKNYLLVFLGIVITGLIIGGAIIYTNKGGLGTQSASSSDAANDGTKQDLSQGGHTVGNPDAPVTIVEFSDFECPYCANFNQTMGKVIKEYPNDIRWVYKHFPLSFHKEARPAAEASECAAEQGEFWGFHDGLFENRERLGESLYTELAIELNLDSGQFEKCVSSRKYKDKVEEDYQEGVKAGVKGTPGNFINGLPLGGAVPYQNVKEMIDDLLGK